MFDNLQNKAYMKILNDILELKYIPGRRITERELLASLDIGRTPVREAILRLRNEGLVNVIPQSGTYVAKIDLQVALSARFVRQKIEAAVVGECATCASEQDLLWLRHMLQHQQRAAQAHDSSMFFTLDDNFHKQFYVMADKLIVWHWMQTMNIQLNRFRRLRVMMAKLPWNSLIRQHTEITQAIEDHDKGRAERLVTEHLNLMLAEQKVLLDEFPEYFTNTGSVDHRDDGRLF